MMETEDFIESQLQRGRQIAVTRMFNIKIAAAGTFSLLSVLIGWGVGDAAWQAIFPITFFFLVSAIAIKKLMQHSQWIFQNSDYIVGVVDAFIIYFIQSNLMSRGDNPTAAATYAIALFSLLIAIAGHGLKKRAVVSTGLLCMVLEAEMIIRAGKTVWSVVTALTTLTFAVFVCCFIIDRVKTMLKNIGEEQWHRQHLGRYFSPKVAEALLSKDETQHSRKQVVTVMFCDIREFTQLASNISEEELIETLNLFYSRMVDHLFKFSGTLDKYTGDGFMAYFGAPLEDPLHAANAVLCALTMKAELTLINETRRNAGKAPLKIGIGIHTGVVVVGTVGSPSRMEFTIIGDTVNVASRIEGLTKQFDESILVSQETRERIGSAIQFRSISSAKIKGKELPVQTFVPFLESAAGQNETQKETFPTQTAV